jgi:hypothetical protein
VHPAVPPDRGSGSAYARLRELCLALPETSEKQSHGEASWFGVYLDLTFDWGELAALVRDAYSQSRFSNERAWTYTRHAVWARGPARSSPKRDCW